MQHSVAVANLTLAENLQKIKKTQFGVKFVKATESKRDHKN